MLNYLQSLMRFNTMKIDIGKGLRQAILMFIPLMIGYLVDYFSIGLLIATGTLAHIYVFGGSVRSKLRIVLLTTCGLSIAMVLGSLTVNQPLIFGGLLLAVTVIPYYIFSALNIPGPSSTFFIVAFSLPINLPYAPEEALTRGVAMFIGGLLATVVVVITIILTKESAESTAIKSDYKMIKTLIHSFNDRDAFGTVSPKAVVSFRYTDNQLITASGKKSKESSKFQRILLLHTLAQGIYSELLELNGKDSRPLPNEIKEMADYIIDMVLSDGKTDAKWSKEIAVASEYQNLVDHIFKVDEIINANADRVEHEVDIRVSIYGQRIIENLTLDSYVFRNTLRYTIIMAIAVFVALMFDFDKAYWIPLSAHTVLIGATTVHSFERAGSRSIGTIIGVLILSLILLSTPPIPVAIILLTLAAGVTEIFVGANYSFAVIFITIQVILLNGLASNHLTILIALPRIIDVIVGVVIAVIGLLILGRKTASSMLPETIADVVRDEAKVFHYLFSENGYHSVKQDKKEMVLLSVKLNNMIQVYNSANGEVATNKKRVRYHYPSIYALEEISFMLKRALNNAQREHIDDLKMGKYLVIFENIAKHFETGKHIEKQHLPELPQYVYIQTALNNIQNNCAESRESISSIETK
ncbi:FUSC family protein [Staphylococcus arlettae]|uniref:FUSC family protein n=1 Tax=Staphylococcus arlettae TaxID=29378 RepID=UPI001E4EF88D|nr:FUSC family protein [Staphylococcus arlettae]MCD8841779.1 FUSC family protein [Staphylococcus arlettae]